MPEIKLSVVTEALEVAWQAIRARHPGLPAVVISVGPGDEGKRGAKWGHFAPERWANGEETQVHEILIAGESFRRQPAETMATLLHEAAHCLARVDGVKDTSRGGRYHNTQFKAYGERFGLRLQKDKTHGWTLTTITSEAAQTYRPQIDAIGKATRAYRAALPNDDDDDKKRATQITLRCACSPPLSIRVTAPVAAVLRCRCEDCGKLFRPMAT